MAPRLDRLAKTGRCGSKPVALTGGGPQMPSVSVPLPCAPRRASPGFVSGRKSTEARTSRDDLPSPSRSRGRVRGPVELVASASAYPVQLGCASVALTTAKATLKACQGRPCAEMRQFGAGNDVRAVALSAFDRELQAEADEVTCRSDVFRGHGAPITRGERNRNKRACGYWGKRTIGAALNSLRLDRPLSGFVTLRADHGLRSGIFPRYPRPLFLGCSKPPTW